MVSMSHLRSKGFTLIEILVVIVIIGILATMGIGKYAQFSRDARKSGCVNNQNTIDKGIGMWESKYVAFNLKSGNNGTLTCLFYMNGKKHTFTESNGRFPGRFKSTATGKDDEVYNQIQDETVFVCPESANSYSPVLITSPRRIKMQHLTTSGIFLLEVVQQLQLSLLVVDFVAQVV